MREDGLEGREWVGFKGREDGLEWLRGLRDEDVVYLGSRENVRCCARSTSIRHEMT